MARRRQIPPPHTSDVLKALTHPAREAILAYMLEHTEPISPSGLVEVIPEDTLSTMKEPLGNVAYHVRSLHAWNILEEASTKPRRGALEHFYVVAPEAVEPVTRLRAAVAAPAAA